jgi:eukaryotic-like serine/threonine-protein kinase
MSGSRWQRLEALFEEALDLAPAQRELWLAALPDDPDLITELRAMLLADAGTDRLEQHIGSAIAAAEQVPVAGSRLGAWRLIGELGSGGVGIVFLAERAEGGFRQQAAIKVIRGLADGDAARQLRHERQILAELDHPGIARLLEGGETAQGQPYLVMEYVRGKPITEAARSRALNLGQRLALVVEVAQAVHHAHQSLIIHRDIKPANVLLREDGRPVLLDFGIAKLLDPSTRRDATQPWFTPGYAAPEQLRGGKVSTATDVYALGLLLSELLCEQPPRYAKDGSLVPPSERVERSRRSLLRGDLDRIVARATALEPARRYPSAQALASDIDRFLQGRPVQAAPDTAGYRLRKLLRRHPWASAATLFAVALLLAMGWRLADERNRALQAEQVALAESRAALATTEFLTELFQRAEPGSGREPLSPTALIDRGREQLAAREDIAPAYRARLLGTLGRIYGYLGQPEHAAETLEAALRDARVAGLGWQVEAELLTELGNAYDDRLAWTEAEASFAAALSLQRRYGQPVGAARALTKVGLIQSRMGHLAEAERLLRQAIDQLGALTDPDSVETAQARVYLAEAMTMGGRAREAQEEMERGVAALRRHLAPDDASLLSALSFQSTQLREAGDAAGAERVLLEVISHRQALLESDSGLLAMAHSALGSAYYEQGRTREATVQFEAALRIGEQSMAPDDPSLAIDLNNVAALYEEMGDYAAALPLMRRALAAIGTRPEEQALRLAQFRQNLGRLLMLAGEREESAQWLQMEVGEGEEAGWGVQRSRRRLHLAEWERRWGDAGAAQGWLDEADAKVDEMGGPAVARYAQLLRTRALLLRSQGQVDAARQQLVQARDLLTRTRGGHYAGVGEIELDMGELAASLRDYAGARAHARAARAVLDPVVVERSPQRERLLRLEAGLASLSD